MVAGLASGRAELELGLAWLKPLPLPKPDCGLGSRPLHFSHWFSCLLGTSVNCCLLVVSLSPLHYKDSTGPPSNHFLKNSLKTHKNIRWLPKSARHIWQLNLIFPQSHINFAKIAMAPLSSLCNWMLRPCGVLGQRSIWEGCTEVRKFGRP